MAISREASPDAGGISRLMLFFAIVYTVEGIGQAKVGVIWQPLTHYLKESLAWTPVQIATSLAVLDVPWIVKPLYGMLSDFLPLFGYRRRSYLLLANVGAVIAAIAPVAIIVSCLSLVEEEPAGINLAEFRRALRGFLDTFRSRTLWLIAAFLFCYYFSPGFGTPLYFHMTDHLGFSQGM